MILVLRAEVGNDEDEYEDAQNILWTSYISARYLKATTSAWWAIDVFVVVDRYWRHQNGGYASKEDYDDDPETAAMKSVDSVGTWEPSWHTTVYNLSVLHSLYFISVNLKPSSSIVMITTIDYHLPLGLKSILRIQIITSPNFSTAEWRLTCYWNWHLHNHLAVAAAAGVYCKLLTCHWRTCANVGGLLVDNTT